MSKVVEAARQFKHGRDFEWMLQPDWDPTDEHRAHYVEISLMMVAEKFDLEEDYLPSAIQVIVSILDDQKLRNCIASTFATSIFADFLRLQSPQRHCALLSNV